MLQLYYNAFHPIEILESLTIKSSISCNRDRGVSMSSQVISSHGPFTFVFRSDRDWYKLFTEVRYGNFPYEEMSLEEYSGYSFTHKREEFREEYEWWAPGPIKFQMNDIQQIVFRNNSAGYKIHPIISKRNYKRLREAKYDLDITQLSEGIYSC